MIKLHFLLEKLYTVNRKTKYKITHYPSRSNNRFLIKKITPLLSHTAQSVGYITLNVKG